MKTTRVSIRLSLFITWLGNMAALAAGVPTLIDAVRTNAQVQVHLAWPAEADRQYDIFTSTNLGSSSWGLATNTFIAPTNLIGEFRHLSTDGAQFFRVATRDTQGPAITSRYPATNGIGVGRFATMTVNLADESGVDTNRFALTFNGLTLTNGSPGVTVASNRFLFLPATNAWGDFGATSVVSFACADVLGNATTSAWTFTLEVQPVVTNVLIHLPPPAGLKNSALAKAAQAKGASFTTNLTILTFETNLLVFSYSGTNHGLYTGGILVSHDPARFFYRQITSLVDNATNHTVTTYTTNVPLTALVKDGTFSPEAFVAVSGAKAAPKWQVELGYALPFSYVSEFSVLPLEFDTDGDDEEDLRITPGILSIDLQGKAEVSCVIKDWQVVKFDASINSQLAAEIRAKVEFLAQADLVNHTTTLISVPLAYVGGFIGPVPVWVELQLGVDLGLEVSAEAAVVFETGLDAYANSEFRLAWRPAGQTETYSGSFDLVPVPLDMQFQLSTEAFLYLKPRLSALLYSLAEVSADYRRGPALEAVWEVGTPQCEITLYDQWSINAGLTIVGVPDGQLPSVTLLQEKHTIQTWHWPEIADAAPVFTRHPASITAAAGATVTLEASATGGPEPTYQWFQNGIGIPFQTGPTMKFTMGSRAVGSYTVMAKNRVGWVSSNPATVSLQTQAPPPSSGMVLIAAGSFQMGNSLDDTWAQPVHSVYVSAFYMDKYEVTKALWDDVYNWAITHGYSFDYAGSGKAATHPVQTVSWYDCVKWCNARSEKEGRIPAYYTSAALTTVYRSGQVSVDNSWVKWNVGYRLPTESEWEKAARGGANEHRFPWSNLDTISHSQANYYSHGLGNPYFPYDVSPTSGYHPTFNDGVYPYTSPVGYFGANGYGLYGIAGNVWEWCWDWYGSYSSGSQSDPRGPTSGLYRVFRGGSWINAAVTCGTASRGDGTLTGGRADVLGFRSVLPPGQ
ncbi:MAG: SUMF1/EgtB/PvdO family nonheme iron enzyme [Verrucomicrobia bacterium]|nr:SUMF1/EgtB/PvdO family nonheme iron enzyme [Verrucomicrobiota bacterium]